MKTTHYIPAFTSRSGSHEQAACGAWVTPRLHACEPTCPGCLTWLREGEDDLLEKFGPEPVTLIDPRRI